MVRQKDTRRRRQHYTLDDIPPLVRLHLLSGKLDGIAPRAALRDMWHDCRDDLMQEWRRLPWAHGHVPWASNMFDETPEVI